jgi:transcriptional regulator with XRE-family HTH domain
VGEDPTFGELLDIHLTERGMSGNELARRLDVSPAKVTRWRNDAVPPQRPADVARIADVLGVHQQEDRRRLFQAAGFVYIEPSSNGSKAPEEGPPATGGTEEEPAPERPRLPGGLAYVVETLRLWWESVSAWAEAPSHARTSWAGMVLYVLGVWTDRLAPQAILRVLVAITLLILTAELLAPIFAWPLEPAGVRVVAFLKFSVGALVIPLVVAAVTKADREDEFDLTSQQARLSLWFLKFTGAVVGFLTFSLIVLLVPMVWYYFDQPPLSLRVRVVLVAIPLFFSYVVSRRIPTDRFKMYENELKLHDADWWFGACFVGLGLSGVWWWPLLYPVLADQVLGPAVLLGISIFMALAAQREEHSEGRAEQRFIVTMGVVIPLVLFGLMLSVAGAWLLPTDQWVYVVMLVLYLVSETLLGAVLWVRRPAILTLRGVMGLAGVVLLLNPLAMLNRWAALAAVVGIGIGWVAWGQRRFRNVLWVHPSWGLLQVAIGVSVGLLWRPGVPVLLNAVGFGAVMVALVWWAARPQESPEPTID